jgi:hypothetical protein
MVAIQEYGVDHGLVHGAVQLVILQSQPTQVMPQLLTGPDMLPFQQPFMSPLPMLTHGLQVTHMLMLFRLLLPPMLLKHVVLSTQLHFQDMFCHKHPSMLLQHQEHGKLSNVTKRYHFVLFQM